MGHPDYEYNGIPSPALEAELAAQVKVGREVLDWKLREQAENKRLRKALEERRD